MNLNITQFVAFGFLIGWVGADALGLNHSQQLFCALVVAFVSGYLNNIHGIFLDWIKTKVRL